MDIRNFINEKGRVSSTKTTEKWVKNNFPDEFKRIKEHSDKIGLKADRFSEEIYHYINNLEIPLSCKKCRSNKPKFFGLLQGYSDYCSSKCSNSSIEVIGKKEKSYLKKYGVDNPSKSKEIVEKIQNTFNLKYGGNPFSLKEIQKKIEETNIQKYGTKSPMEKNSSLREDLDKKATKKFLEKYSNFDIINFDSDKNGNAFLKCKKCDQIFEISKWNLHQRTKYMLSDNICTICNPIGSSNDSFLEDFIRDFLSANLIYFEEKNREILNGKEIDFYIPNKKIGIEVNGLFWHSEKFKSNNYHIEKTNIGLEKNIFIIHIFEDEIKKTPDLVRSRLSSILGINQTKIFARKCKIKEITKEEASSFVEKTHLQGTAGSKVRFGLFYNNQLVSIMTFGSLRKSLGSEAKQNHWELIRFSNEIGVNVIGGASRLLKHFISIYNPEKIISYCDRRWSNGDFYKKIGFYLDGITRPNYFYAKNGLRENRFKYRKNVLISNGFSSEKSESKIMNERGFLKIYDCGNYRFVWEKGSDEI